ncbi:MAG: hypothetical protein HYR90_01490 [Candidatus Andersenbacteria bacterium]|nr:hypothetical protein [Candidatus Andersenbacteria bacterium]MBI3250831.1 hypothetical protein [Candidatus Andersenbacteria bacterium]
MISQYLLRVAEQQNDRVIDFTNNTSDFVEVVFDVDGKEVKGYCYPPRHHKPVRRMRTGEPLPLGKHGVVTAYVYPGEADLDERDLDIPPFLRWRLKKKVRFHRTSQSPAVVLTAAY